MRSADQKGDRLCEGGIPFQDSVQRLARLTLWPGRRRNRVFLTATSGGACLDAATMSSVCHRPASGGAPGVSAALARTMAIAFPVTLTLQMAPLSRKTRL
jgi:hypothetical protein